MVEQSGPIVVRSGVEFRFWIGSARSSRARTAKVVSGELVTGCTFNCNGRLFTCKTIWYNGNGKITELCIVGKPSDYDNARCKVPMVMML